MREQAAGLKHAFDAGSLSVRQGPSDPYPVEEHEPIASGLLPDYVFSVQQFRGRPCVVVEFRLEGGPPGLRWLHRFEPPTSPYPKQGQSLMKFQEGVDCWIGRSLARVPAGTSPVWTDFSWGHHRGRWSEALGLFGNGELDQAAALLREGDSDAEDQDQADQIATLAAVGDAATAEQLRKRIWQTFRERNRRTQEADRAASSAFMQEHRSLDGSWSSAWSRSARG